MQTQSALQHSMHLCRPPSINKYEMLNLLHYINTYKQITSCLYVILIFCCVWRPYDTSNQPVQCLSIFARIENSFIDLFTG